MIEQHDNGLYFCVADPSKQFSLKRDAFQYEKRLYPINLKMLG